MNRRLLVPTSLGAGGSTTKCLGCRKKINGLQVSATVSSPFPESLHGDYCNFSCVIIALATKIEDQEERIKQLESPLFLGLTEKGVSDNLYEKMMEFLYSDEAKEKLSTGALMGGPWPPDLGEKE
jgi:hypothetical protein